MSESTVRHHDHSQVAHGKPFPLTPMQEAYWIGRQDGQALNGTGCHAYLELDGHDIGRDRLGSAVDALIRRHDMLRMRVLDDGRQQIMGESPWRGLTVHDLRAQHRGDVETKLLSLRERLANQWLDPGSGHVLDVHLSIADGGFSRVHLMFDLLAVDGQSVQVLLGDLGRLYADPSRPLPPLNYGFPQYLVEQSAILARERDDALLYWRRLLPDLPGRPALPLAREPETVAKPTFRRVEHRISAQDWGRLVDNARTRGVTPAMALTTAYAETLGFWSAEPRFLINLPLFNRRMTDPAVPRLVGDFSNFVLVPVDVSTSMPFEDRARAVQANFLENMEHSAFYGVEVLRELTTVRPDTTSHAPVVFTFNIRRGESVDAGVRQLGELVHTAGRTPQVWIDHQAHLVNGEIRLIWEAVDELFPPGVTDEMATAHAGLVNRLTRDEAWSQPLTPSLPRRQQQVRAAANSTTTPVSGELLHGRFFRHARQHPERVALVWGEDGHLSYGQLADAALRVAASLGSLGVRREEPVGVALPRGPEQIAAVLGVLAHGAAYVPLAGQPASRRRRITTRAGIRYTITGSRDDDGAGAQPLVYADTVTTTPAAEPAAGSPEDLAYVIFTSGSTGEPKGVELPHRAAVNTIDHVNTRFGVRGEDRGLLVSSVDFDLSVYDIFGLLSAGGSLVVFDEDHRATPEAWVDLMSRHRVTVWNSVPAVLDMLLTAGGPGLSLPDLRLALVSGDWIGLDLPGRVADATRGRCRFVALGGPTETAVWSNAFEVLDQPADWPSIPYGFPLSNQCHRVVDQRGRDRPDWVPGELWVGGIGVAKGYRGDPRSTAARFVEHADRRWFRTGDLVRYRPGGVLEFLGRLDHQVKVQGNRIELGEVEAALRDCRQVAHAVVVAAGRGLAQHLVAFVVADADDLDLDVVRAHTAVAVPAYMLPARYYVLDELPLNHNGKVDRATLATWTSTEEAAAPSEPPHDGWEQTLAAEWDLLLDNKVHSREDNFFALGGNSMLATRLVGALRARFGAATSVRDLFTSPTVVGMANLLAHHANGQTPSQDQAKERGDVP